MSNADVELIAPFEGRINAGKVGADELADGGVTTGKIAAAAVTKPKLGTGFIGKAVVAGGAAGAITVTGIATADALILVLYLAGAGTAVTDAADLTAEFTITGANTINNTGGTATTGGKLLVIYQDRA